MASYFDALFDDYGWNAVMEHHGDPVKVTYRELRKDKTVALEVQVNGIISDIDKLEQVDSRGNLVRLERSKLVCDTSQETTWNGIPNPLLHGEVEIDGTTWQVNPEEQRGIEVHSTHVVMYLMRWLPMYAGLEGHFE